MAKFAKDKTSTDNVADVVEVKAQEKRSLASKLYSKSAFANKEQRPKVIVSTIVLVLFVIIVALFFIMYNFGTYIPGVSPVVDKVPILSNLDRSAQNILPKTATSEQNVTGYHFNVNFALDSAGSSTTSGNIAQSFSGTVDFSNPKNVQLQSSLAEKISSSKSAFNIDGQVKQTNNKMYLNFSKFPSVLNTGIKLNQWVILPKPQFNFLEDLTNQSNMPNINTLTVAMDGNEILNGTSVTKYQVTYPKADFSSINLSKALESLSGMSNMQSIISSKTITVDEWIGVADNKIYQESVKFSVTGQTPTTLYFGISMSNFNAPFSVTAPAKTTTVSGSKSTSSSTGTKSSGSGTTSSKK